MTLTYGTPGPGAYQDAEVASYVKPFENLTGAKVVLTVENNAKLTAMVKAGNVSLDVTDVSPFFARTHCNEILQPTDISGIEGSFANGDISPCGRPSSNTTSFLMYNSKTFPNNPPTKLADFFDPKKYPGARVLADFPPGYFEIALLADGVDPSNLYPIDDNRAMKMFDKIKSDTKVTPTGSLEQQLMLNNQADLAIVPSTRAYSVIKAGGDYWKIVRTPIVLSGNAWGIPKGSPHPAAAAAFIKFASQPAQQQKFAELVGGLAPANKAVKPTYTGLAAEVNPLSFSPQIQLDADYWSKNYDRLVNRFEQWATT